MPASLFVVLNAERVFPCCDKYATKDLYVFRFLITLGVGWNRGDLKERHLDKIPSVRFSKFSCSNILCSGLCVLTFCFWVRLILYVTLNLTTIDNLQQINTKLHNRLKKCNKTIFPIRTHLATKPRFLNYSQKKHYPCYQPRIY